MTVPGILLEHVEIAPIVGAFRRMCRHLEFDVCEMAITTYLTARAYGKPFTALPVFVMRQFHHAPIVYNVTSGVTSPKDLEGKRVGVRAYTVTTGVWARGILASGVWRRSRQGHVGRQSTRSTCRSTRRRIRRTSCTSPGANLGRDGGQG